MRAYSFIQSKQNRAEVKEKKNWKRGKETPFFGRIIA